MNAGSSPSGWRRNRGTLSRAGSIQGLAASLERDGIRPKGRRLSNGKLVLAERFMVGPLAHILKNRFYIGEVVYRGETNRGTHEPIVDRDLFEAVQTKLWSGVVARSQARITRPSILAGRLFDDRGNALTPTHANKKGVRYRYYVSQALLQGRPKEVGSVSRVAAPDVEQAILETLRATGDTASSTDLSDQDLSGSS